MTLCVGGGGHSGTDIKNFKRKGERERESEGANDATTEGNVSWNLEADRISKEISGKNYKIREAVTKEDAKDDIKMSDDGGRIGRFCVVVRVGYCEQCQELKVLC